MTSEQLEYAINALLEGDTYQKIADHLNVPISTLHSNLARPEYSARAREALVISADVFADKAEKVLIEANWDREMGDFDLKKARELSQYYKWKASKRNPKSFGDKVDVTTDGDKIQSFPVINWVNGDNPQ